MKLLKNNKLVTALIGAGVAILLVLSLCTESTNHSITESTVMITNMKENSGGTGVVVSLGKEESTILTNSHVCGLIKVGGKVKTNSGEMHLIKAYLNDVNHDLCLVKIPSRLKSSAKLAQRNPNLFEPATIAGHPQLMPTIVTQGHFADRQVITVLTGIEKCTKDQEEDEDSGAVCFFFGGMPIIKVYESVVVSATIMAGSSGSAVYNSDRELSGLVFAGSQGLSYAFIVPYEYVYSFLKEAAHSDAEFTKVEYGKDLITIMKENESSLTHREIVRKKCNESKVPKQVAPFCEAILNTI